MIGKTISHYKILEKLGEGGMGVVYKAEDTKLDRMVAMKFLPKQFSINEEEKKRFIHEAKAAAALDHPNICNIYEIDETKDGQMFIAMAFYEGKTLKEIITERPLPITEAIDLTIQIAEGLNKAHKKDIVHRDIKSANIIITNERVVKILDFGLAKFRGQTKITKEGTTLGTVAYMSPEQASGEKADFRSDIWSLGVLLYEMVTGQLPFKGEYEQAIMYSIMNEEPEPVTGLRTGIPIEMERIINKILEKDPRERYQGTTDLLVDLKKVKKEELPTREKVKHDEKSFFLRVFKGKFYQRKRLITAIVSIVFMVLIMLVLWFVSQNEVSNSQKKLKPISLLIADFENHTGDQVFDGSIEHTLNLGLKGFPFISIYNRFAALKIANQLDSNVRGKLNSKTAQAICRKVGLDLTLTGSIKLSKKGYIIDVWGLHPNKFERTLEMSKEISKKTDLLKTIDEIAHQVAQKIGGIKLRYNDHLTTISLEAMHAFSKARRLEDEGKNKEAIREYLSAIEKDPDFGGAYSNLAVVYYNIGQEKKSIEYYEKALAHIDRLSEREKILIRAKYYLIVRNYKKAIEAFCSFLKQFPKNNWAQTNLPLAYFFARDMNKAFEEGKRSLELPNKSITAQFNFVWYAMASGNFKLAENTARSFLQQNPEFGDIYVCLALLEIVQGNTDPAIKTYEKLKNLSPRNASYAIIGLADLSVYEGRLLDAEEILEQGISEDLKKGWNDFAAEKLIILAQNHLIRRKKNLAINAADRAVISSKKIGVLYSAAKIFLSAGEKEKTLTIIKKLSKRIYPECQSYAKLLEGEVKLSQGETQTTLKLFLESQSLVDTWLSHFALGRAYFKAGAYTEAHEEFELCIKRRGEVAAIFLDDIPSYRYLPPVYYYFGRVQEELKSSAAAESYKTFLSIKKNGEMVPMVEDARKRVKELEENK